MSVINCFLWCWRNVETCFCPICRVEQLWAQDFAIKSGFTLTLSPELLNSTDRTEARLHIAPAPKEASNN
ncbi:hypothetical protein Ddc_15363 [Ditylenchus destructor]|nr:hypothetical protein Ddc_15363 [Ditylenchus destructor]